MKTFPDMKHLVWLLYDAVGGFSHYMFYYFTPAIVLSALAVIGAVSWLARSKKPILIGSAGIAFLWAAFALCTWSDVRWKLYCYGIHGQFHLPAQQQAARR